MLRRSGRRTARYAANSDVHGRLAERRFDLNPDPPPYRPSPQEAAESAFKVLSQQDKDSLTGWAATNLSRAVPRAPWDGSQKTGLLQASALADQASLDLNRSVTAAQIAGALLTLGFEAITPGPSPSDLRICAVWKDSYLWSAG